MIILLKILPTNSVLHRMSTVKMKIILVMLASQLSLTVTSAVVDDGTQHQRVRYNNVFFSDPVHMKGRPSTSFVMVSFITTKRLILQ